jgi:hypothetical protein
MLCEFIEIFGSLYALFTVEKGSEMLVPKLIRPYGEPFVRTPKNQRAASGGHTALE